MRLFLLGSVVLIVLAIIASASSSASSLGVNEFTWFMAAFLAFLTDLLVGPYVNDRFGPKT